MTVPHPGFSTLDRAAWAALRTGTRAAPPEGLISAADWLEVYTPLADLVARQVAAAGSSSYIVALSGSVAAGKSTVARGLAALLANDYGVSIVSTDGFLLPNSVLGPRGRVGHKGFPDTYDHELMGRVLDQIAAGEPEVSVPLYSHETYDVSLEHQVVSGADIVIVEGVNAFDGRLRVYLDATEPDLRTWFVVRFLGLIEDARGDDSSFFAQWVGLSRDEARALAVAVWEGINLVNLQENILPRRWDADIVLHKGRDHAVEWVAIRPGLLDRSLP